MSYKDKEKQKEYQRKWHQKNKAEHRKSIRSYDAIRRAKNRKIARRLLVFKGCYICGYNKSFYGLCFHHVDPKNKKCCVSALVGRGYSLETIRAEIDKCVIRCANCHQIKTAHQLGYYKVSMDNPQ